MNVQIFIFISISFSMLNNWERIGIDNYFFLHKKGSEKITAGEISEILKEVEGNIDSELKEREKREGGEVKQMGKIFEKTDLTEASKLDTEQLDILAILCTVIKIMFIHGKSFETQKKIAEKLEKIRKGKELHKTTIRNENAYYCCISQLYEFISYPLPSHKAIYVFGDSHCLPTAWQTLNIQNTPRLLVPKLVTGCKIWHLRPESYFFTKLNFHNVLATSESFLLFFFCIFFSILLGCGYPLYRFHSVLLLKI